MKSEKTKRLVTSSMLIALAAVLSLVKIWQMPLGGSITLLSMLPICVISIKYGVRWGLFAAFVYSLVQIALDFGSLMSWGMTFATWAGCLIFDYIIAYTSLGLAGIFRDKNVGGIIAGITLAMFLRFASHFVSGAIFFDIWAPEGWNVYLYSLAYNGLYMLPELILTVIAATALFAVPVTKRLIAE
ncbi:MAG: energy-coupled thiamine transporter ThiT [Ruminococcus sp.]|nr:energy-coupled thiamine transporter ThiT [Ruminococcus sp.]